MGLDQDKVGGLKDLLRRSTGGRVTELALYLRALGHTTGGFKNGGFCFKKITVDGRGARLELRECDSTRASEGVN